MKETWTAVDDYFTTRFLRTDPELDAAIAASKAAGLPEIQVSPPQGKLLHLLARSIGARRILEIGTLGGYSTIWLARALPPDGFLLTLEFEPKHAAVARKNLDRAGFEQSVEVRVGDATASLAQLIQDRVAPFDVIFIDANKSGYPGYFAQSLQLARPGTLIIADNVVRQGGVTDATSPDENIQGVRRFTELVAREPRVSATAIQTVGSKGYDGFACILVER